MKTLRRASSSAKGLAAESRVTYAVVLCLLSVGFQSPRAQIRRFVHRSERNTCLETTRVATHPDFSHAATAAARFIPDVPTRITVAPGEGDGGAGIQAAINYVASLPPDTDGFRGAVHLAKGRFEIAGPLRITNSGVVLRGSGPGADGTVLVATGNSRRTLIELRGAGDRRTNGPLRNVTSACVPVNASTLELDSTGGLHVGDHVLVRRPSPTNWISFAGMTAVSGRPAPSWARDEGRSFWNGARSGDREASPRRAGPARSSGFRRRKCRCLSCPRVRTLCRAFARESEWNRANSATKSIRDGITMAM